MSSHKSEKNCAAGGRLKEERERIGLSQEDFGQKIGASKRTVLNWERGDSGPDLFQIIEIGFGLGMDTNYILYGRRTPIGAAQPKASYTPAEKAAEQIRDLKLSKEDAEMVVRFCKRLSESPE